MEDFSRQWSTFLVSFLSLFFLGGFVSSVYLELNETDIFSPNPCFENQDLATSASREKTKVNLSLSYFEHPLLSNCKSFLHVHLVLPIALENPINCPIRC
jgi:hypothetical protein